MEHTTSNIQHKAEAGKKLLIVGLGNPDQEYENTLHNVGFRVLDGIAEDQGLSWKKIKPAQGETVNFVLNDREAALLKPLTYMNKSGLSVKNALSFWKINLNNLLIVQDDSDILVGKLKVAFDQSSGGHKGLESIIQALKSQKFSRIKLGVRAENLSSAKNHIKAEKFILRPQSKTLLDNISSSGKEAVYSWIEHGLAKTMTEFNSSG